jgi:hypothetical protein
MATMAPVDPADTAAAASPRRTSWHATATQAGQRALVHGQVVLGRHYLDLVDRAHPAEHLAQLRLGPGQQDPDAMLALGRERPGDDLAGRVIPAHGVDRDHGAGGGPLEAHHTGRGPPRGRAGQEPSGISRVRVTGPGRVPPFRAVRRHAQRITGIRDRGRYLIVAVPFQPSGGVVAPLWP